MTTLQLRARLLKRLEKLEDKDLLSLIDRMLERATKPDAMRAAMLTRAIEANEDIKAGRTYGYNEALQRVKDSIRRK